MEHIQWLAQVAGDDTTNATAQKANIYTATLGKQIKRGTLSPEVVIAIARGYGVSVVSALVACEYITAEEAGVKEVLGIEEALRDATDAHLLTELLRRVDDDGSLAHPELTIDIAAPLSPSGGVFEVYDGSQPPARHAAQEEAADELPDFTQLAARTVSRRPGWDASQVGTDAGDTQGTPDNWGEDSQLPPEDWDD